jgi:hypothetical protein
MVTAILINPLFRKFINKKKSVFKIWMAMLVLLVGFITGVMYLPGTEDTNSEAKESIVVNNEETMTSEIDDYTGMLLDLEKLEEYPFGESLENVLLEIGVDDALEAICEKDNSVGLTLRLTTKTKRLWISIDDYFDDVREVNWIKDYDNNIYYYISNELNYNKPIYSYKSGEIIKDKVDGESEEYPLIITADQLVNEINTDIKAAKEKYNGKWIQITGTVTYVSEYSIGGGLYGYYLYGKFADEGLKITCWMDDSKKRAYVGETKTFLGIMREVTTVNNTEITKCKIVE